MAEKAKLVKSKENKHIDLIVLINYMYIKCIQNSKRQNKFDNCIIEMNFVHNYDHLYS